MTKRSFLHPNYAISSNTYDAMAKQLERDLRRQCPTPTWNVLKTDDLDHHHAMDRFTFIVVCTNCQRPPMETSCKSRQGGPCARQQW